MFRRVISSENSHTSKVVKSYGEWVNQIVGISSDIEREYGVLLSEAEDYDELDVEFLRRFVRVLSETSADFLDLINRDASYDKYY